MKRVIISLPRAVSAVACAALTCAALTTPAFADTYPVSGRWGQSASSEKGAIECHGRRVIAFHGNQRTDSKGGVPAFRNQSVTPEGASRYRVVDVFTTGQISNAHVNYTLRRIDADHWEMSMPRGGALMLQKCK